MVVQCEHTQLAMEEEIARDIHVWREGPAALRPAPPPVPAR
jgi:hypothetical protein